MIVQCPQPRASRGRTVTSANLCAIERDQGPRRGAPYPHSMADDISALREKLKRFQYLRRMVDDEAVRGVLDEEIAELERRLAPFVDED